jgi:hypothetical protein
MAEAAIPVAVITVAGAISAGAATSAGAAIPPAETWSQFLQSVASAGLASGRTRFTALLAILQN